MKPDELMEKAIRAVASAKLLQNAGDVDGACNRAYYAMFDAARAALMGARADAEPAAIKTHSGLIAALGLRLVKPGVLPLELGKAMNRVAEIRLVADYTGDEVSADTADWCIAQAELFVAAIGKKFSTGWEQSVRENE